MEQGLCALGSWQTRYSAATLLERPRCPNPMANRAPGSLGRPKATTAAWTGSMAERMSALMVAGHSESLSSLWHGEVRHSSEAAEVSLELLWASKSGLGLVQAQIQMVMASASPRVLVLVLVLVSAFSVTPSSMPTVFVTIPLVAALTQLARRKH